MGRGGTIWHLEMEDNDWMYEDDEGLEEEPDDDEEEIDEIGVVPQGEDL